MCGISGTLHLDDPRLLKEMLLAIKHRGPDESDYYISDDVMLGHNRLAIIDLESGRQPLYSKDGNTVIVYNGEAYNFRELRNELELEGIRFATRTDTEVVLQRYLQRGIKAFSELNGMFSLAIWNQVDKELILARDRWGIKPLYYTQVNGALLFASEIKALLQYEEVKKEINSEAVCLFLNMRYVPGPLTLFNDIYKLLPGHFLLANRNGISTRPYFSEQSSSKQIYSDIASASDMVRPAIEAGVQRHLISDVPLGVYLSGGIDSTLLVALASRMMPEPIHTFCMGFGEENDELQDARTAAEAFGTNHHEIVVDHGLLDPLPQMIWHADVPKRNLYPYHLAKFARSYVKVALSGLGADELFAGYDFRYRNILFTSGDKNPSPGERVRLYLASQGRDFLPASYTSSLLGPRMHPVEANTVDNLCLPYFSDGRPFLEQVLDADLRLKMCYDFLFVDDATSMAHGLETRVPYLDNDVVSCATRIPLGLKFDGREGKIILKRAFSSVLPERARTKRKQGFGPDPSRVFASEIREYLGLLSDGYAVKEGVLARTAIEKFLVADPMIPPLVRFNKIWDLLAFEVWYRLYFVESGTKYPTKSLSEL